MIIYPLTANEPLIIEFARPAALMNMNDRTHWTTYSRNARAWRATATFAALKSLRPTSLPLAPSIVTVELPVLGNRRRDPHNLFPTVKHAVDGLVDAGLWPDDTPEWVTTTEPRLRPCTRAEHAVAPVRIHITARSST